MCCATRKMTDNSDASLHLKVSDVIVVNAFGLTIIFTRLFRCRSDFDIPGQCAG